METNDIKFILIGTMIVILILVTSDFIKRKLITDTVKNQEYVIISLAIVLSLSGLSNILHSPSVSTSDTFDD